MHLPRRSLLALAAVLDVALYARPIPVSSKALAERLGLPNRHLEPLLQMLVRSGLLKGTRGPRGGYELARERRRISIGDVLRAIDEDLPPSGEIRLVDDILMPALTPPMQALSTAIDSLDFEALCTQARTANARGEFHDVGL